jgi:hypothetical protein
MGVRLETRRGSRKRRAAEEDPPRPATVILENIKKSGNPCCN